MHCSLTSNGSLQLVLALHTHETPRKRHSASRGGKSITTLIQHYPVYTLSMCDKLKLNFSSVGVDMCFSLGACRRLHSTETAEHYRTTCIVEAESCACKFPKKYISGKDRCPRTHCVLTRYFIKKSKKKFKHVSLSFGAASV